MSSVAFEVEARDQGTPALSTRLSITADILQTIALPRCALPLYETTLREDMPVGSCVIEVSTIIYLLN